MIVVEWGGEVVSLSHEEWDFITADELPKLLSLTSPPNNLTLRQAILHRRALLALLEREWIERQRQQIEQIERERRRKEWEQELRYNEEQEELRKRARLLKEEERELRRRASRLFKAARALASARDTLLRLETEEQRIERLEMVLVRALVKAERDEERREQREQEEWESLLKWSKKRWKARLEREKREWLRMLEREARHAAQGCA
jgi:hypothetical protein